MLLEGLRSRPSDVPLPAIHYDPESRKHGAKRATLHAKCVVVDRRWAFVTSANFTEAAQERNIEAGVLLDHPRLAEALAGQFEALKEERTAEKDERWVAASRPGPR